MFTNGTMLSSSADILAEKILCLSSCTIITDMSLQLTYIYRNRNQNGCQLTTKQSSKHKHVIKQTPIRHRSFLIYI